MRKDLDSLGPGHALFACGHENSQGNHYCDVCGAARDRRKCPACNAPNREEAKFCRACGARLLDEGAAREPIVATATQSHFQHPAALPTRATTGWLAGDPAVSELSDLLGPRNLEEASPRSGRERWRRDGRSLSSLEEDTLGDDTLAEEDYPPEPRRKRLFLKTVAAILVACAAFAIGLAAKQFVATWHEATLGRPATSPPVAPASPRITGERSPDSTSANPSVAHTAQTAPPRVATVNPSLSKATRKPASTDAAQEPEPKPTLPPPQTPTEQPAKARDQAPSEPTPRLPESRAETSEERMADFLVERLGPVQAAETALSNAAWYDASQSEHAYWQGVAQTIRRGADR